MICFQKLKNRESKTIKATYGLAYYSVANWVKREGGDEADAKAVFGRALAIFIENLSPPEVDKAIDLPLYLKTVAQVIWKQKVLKSKDYEEISH